MPRSSTQTPNIWIQKFPLLMSHDLYAVKPPLLAATPGGIVVLARLSV